MQISKNLLFLLATLYTTFAQSTVQSTTNTLKALAQTTIFESKINRTVQDGTTRQQQKPFLNEGLKPRHTPPAPRQGYNRFKRN